MVKLQLIVDWPRRQAETARVARTCAPLLRLLPVLLLGLILSSCSPAGTDYFPAPESEGGWRKRTDPEFVRSLGMDPDRLEEFGRYNLSIPSSNWKPYADYKGILVIKDGWIIGEWYNVPEAKSFRTYLSSNGKSVAAMCFGIMVNDGESGRIPIRIGPESKVYDRRWLPGGFPLSDPLKSAITFEQIFQHTSGLCPERNGMGEPIEQGRNQWTEYEDWVLGHDEKWPQTGKIYFRPDQAEEWPDKEVWGTHAGGYSSVGFGHIGLVLRNVYEMPARQFLWTRLLEPLGFSGIDFHAPPSEEIQWFSAGGLRMTPRDYARYAYFLLQDGRWQDQQIVPASWVRKFIESIRYPNTRSNHEGYFGPYPRDMFWIAGSGLNWAFIVPSLDLIAIRTGRSGNAQWDEVEQQFLQKLFAAVRIPEAARGEVSYPAADSDQIVADAERPRWLWRAGGSPFFMVGPGDPEGFLYRGLLNPDGTRNGDQMELLAKMKGTGANCIYLMAVRSHGGDGEGTENPFVDHDPDNEINERVLDQWERWFTVMDRHRITIFFFFFDDGARLAPRRTPISAQERRLIQTLVNRFKHHRNLIWCIAEEYQEAFTAGQVLDLAAEIRKANEYAHPIAVHKLSGTDFSEFADSDRIDQFAIQLGNPQNPAALSQPKKVHELVLEAWKKSGGRYNVNMSELAGHYVSGDRLLTRRKSWAAAMAGAYVMVIGMDIETTDREALRDAGSLARFFESTDFYRMEPRDELALADTEYILASEDSYILYSSGPALQMGVRALTPGRYTLRWFDCGSRREVTQEGISVADPDRSWKVPTGFGEDVALYLKKEDP